MEFIKEEDLELITACAFKEVNKADFDKLKHIYEKLEHICILLQSKGYIYDIRKDPRKQAGQSGFVFQEYQWAKIYPKEYYDAAKNKFAYIIGFTDSVQFHMMGIKDFQEKPASKSASTKSWTEINIDASSYDEIVEEFVHFDKKYRTLFIETGAALGIHEFIKIKQNMEDQDVLNLLRYKKQIILQGPPGTGKTKLAKKIARELILPQTITVDDIKTIMKAGHTIYSISDCIPYKVETINDNGVILKLENGSVKTTSYDNIIVAYSNLLENKALTGGDAYQAAIAKYIKGNWGNEKVSKIIQFHPSYSYEDFVRGIVAESKGDKIAYTNVNKIFGLLAKDALENYELSQRENTEVQIDKWINESFTDFKSEIEKDVEEKEIILSGNIGIFEVDSSCFRYGKESGTPSRLNFTDFRKVIRAALAGIINPEQNNIPKEISLHAHYRFTYYLALLKIFLNKYQFTPTSKRQEQKNYVLIIDEINRANLSSVLGELIYALEYRGEKVESMYVVNDSNKLILPPNLYIIGTMNTADRSVGHIDYAIRRRFAFVDVLPKDLSSDLGTDFKSDIFKTVYNLFYDADKKYLSSEFEPDQVCLGHSYFIQHYEKDEQGNPIKDKPIDFKLRLQYEIISILQEYIKDGVLKDSEELRGIIKSLVNDLS